MRLSSLLKAHDEAVTAAGLTGNLGDGFLLAHNPWFASIRSMSQELGFAFVAETGPLGDLYRCLPLLALEDVLLQRAVPYVDNVRPLRALVASGRDADLPTFDLLHALHRNYLLHEASHCVAHHFICDDCSLRASLEASLHDGIERLLLAEAVANAVETFAASRCQDPLGGLFFALNSYVPYDRESAKTLGDLEREMGMAKALELTIAAFFAAQLCPTSNEAPREVAEHALQLARVTAPALQRSTIEALLQCGFGLSTSFRSITAPMFFRFLNVRDLPFALEGVRFPAAWESHSARVSALATALTAPGGNFQKGGLLDAC